MATAAEKEALGLEATASDPEVMARILALVTPIEGQAAELAFDDDSNKIAVLSMTGQTRPCGTYMIPHTHPLVLDLNKLDPRSLGEFEADPRVLKVRTDTPLTPESDIARYTRA